MLEGKKKNLNNLTSNYLAEVAISLVWANNAVGQWQADGCTFWLYSPAVAILAAPTRVCDDDTVTTAHTCLVRTRLRRPFRCIWETQLFDPVRNVRLTTITTE